MSYETDEKSAASGRPIELHYLWDELGNNCRITSGPFEVTFNSYLYTSEPAKRSELKLTDNSKSDEMTLELSKNNSFANRYLAGPIEARAYWQIYRGHGSDFVNFWSGSIKQVKFEPDGTPLIIAATQSSSGPKAGRRHVCQKLCGNVLYDAGCKLNEEDYAIEGTVDSISGLVITSTAFGSPPGYSSKGDITSLSGCVYSASSYVDSARTPAMAFDDMLPPRHYWSSTSNSNQWICCRWTTAKIIRVVRIQPCRAVGFSPSNPRHIKIEGSNNGGTWYKVPIVGWVGRCSAYNADEAELEQIDNVTEFIHLRLSNSTAYTYYRVYCYDNWGEADHVAIGEIEMLEYDAGTCEPLAGGMITAGGTKRIITAHSGNTVTVNRSIQGVNAGDPITAYPGCDHTSLTCEAKFDNKINYTGDEHLPNKNPFKGTPLA